MKSIFLNTLSFILLAIAPVKSFSTTTTATEEGSITKVSNWKSSPSNPNTFDTLIINSKMTWPTGTTDWSTSTINVIIIKSRGSLSPAGNNAVLLLPANAIIVLETGAQLYNGSGNNSNHFLYMGNIGVWGKSVCPGSAFLTLQGPGKLDKTSPCGLIALPLTLLEFKANFKNNYNQLQWTVTAESGIFGYDLARSYDGKTFVSITQIELNNADGSSSIQKYNYTDYSANKENKIVYYRLSEIDINRSQLNLSTVASSNPEFVNHFSVNWDAKAVSVISPLNDDDITSITVFDLAGREVCKSTKSKSVDISSLNHGTIYIVNIQIEGEPAKTSKILTY